MNPGNAAQQQPLAKEATTYVGPYRFSNEAMGSDQLKQVFDLCFGEFSHILYSRYCEQYGIKNQEDVRETTQHQR